VASPDEFEESGRRGRWGSGPDTMEKTRLRLPVRREQTNSGRGRSGATRQDRSAHRLVNGDPPHQVSGGAIYLWNKASSDASAELL
jgi:hypothetical protein